MQLGEMRFMGDFRFFSPRPISSVWVEREREREREREKERDNISALLENRGVSLIFLENPFILHLLEM